MTGLEIRYGSSPTKPVVGSKVVGYGVPVPADGFYHTGKRKYLLAGYDQGQIEPRNLILDRNTDYETIYTSPLFLIVKVAAETTPFNADKFVFLGRVKTGVAEFEPLADLQVLSFVVKELSNIKF